MPLRFDVEEYLGTNADHSCSDEYCYYCLKDGNYTVDISMNEMVDKIGRASCRERVYVQV